MIEFDISGVGRLMIIARSQDMYNRQCVFTSNKILAALWEVKDIKRQLKSMVSLCSGYLSV